MSPGCGFTITKKKLVSSCPEIFFAAKDGWREKYGDLKIKLPANHRLRLIDKYIRFEFVRARLKDSHSDRGRWPSIDPGVLLRNLLTGHLYAVPKALQAFYVGGFPSI